MSLDIKIKRGLDIRLVGEAEKVTENLAASETYAIKPTDFTGLTPKLMAREGDEVKAGSPLFYSKDDNRVVITSPVSGEVVEVIRGAKRKIMGVKVLADKQTNYLDFGKADPSSLSGEEVKEKLLKSGVWSYIRQRPYNVIANPDDQPKAVVVSAFDSSPLAPDYDYVIEGQGDAFQAGLNALAKLTTGKVHLNVRQSASSVFTGAKGVQVNKVSGPHPAGNVGVQIHHIDPIGKGEKVWVVSVQDVVIIGKLFLEGKYDATKVLALTGSQVKSPKYYRLVQGATVKSLVADKTEGDHNRIISGNVLTGDKVSLDDYLGFYHSQVTVIPEGDEPEFMGWLAPGFDKFSASRTFFTWLTPSSKKFKLDTGLHGEERAFVMSGEYERVLPMDIYPVQLLKASLANDIELMEGLGIYEVDEEDFALCEYVCTSKIEVQSILREGLDLVRSECG